MSSSIRPPGAPPAPSSVDEVGPLREGPAGVGESDPMRQARPSSSEGVASSPTAEWLRRLDAGEVTKDQAIAGLVAQAVEAHGGARLSAAQRHELADVLRQTLLNDPVLGTLLRGD